MSPKSPSRRNLISAIGLGGVAAGLGAGRAKAEPTISPPTSTQAPVGAPNIIVLLMDDLGYSDLGCYGGELLTPHYDSLARTGGQYTNFHTTAVCSSTRAALLTGLNHHSAGMGYLADVDNGTPGYRGDLAHDALTMAEHFGAQGWATYHVGKWHLNSFKTDTNLGDPVNWPLQRGFERAYWFHGYSSDYFRPAEFREGNSSLEIEAGEDYYISDDLTDRAISDLRRHHAMTPDKPFFLYLAHAAPHTPIQARSEDLARVGGRYDMGWDALRADRLERQKVLGVAPVDAVLPERDLQVPAWNTLSADEQKLHARYMEVYAAVVERLDWNMGRLLSALEELGVGDDTIIVVMSDNGGSPDAGPTGTPNLLSAGAGGATLQQNLAMFDEIGGRDSCPGYSLGWAMASCTPFRMYKHHTFGGGVSDPLLIRWPKGLEEQGKVRRQYVHVIDILPTLLEAAKVEPLAHLAGQAAKPIEGLSFAASFATANAPTVRREQYFEMEGKRAYHTDDWEVVSSRNYGQPLEVDRWQLFDARRDYNQTKDLSAQHPDKVRELEALWWAAARRYQVLPLDLRTTAERYFAGVVGGGGRQRWEIVPPMERFMVQASPPLFGHTYSVEVHLAPRSWGEGVLFSYGSMFLGCALYVKDGKLIYEAQARPNRYAIETTAPLSRNARVIRLETTLSQRPFLGTSRLMVDGEVVGDLPQRQMFFGRPYQGFEVGRNGGVPVSLSYRDAFPYSGKIEKVIVDIDTSAYTQEELDAMARRFGAASRA